MKKRRIVAFALATTMLFSSFSTTAFAEETVSPAAVESVPAEAVADETVSDAAVEAYAADATLRGGLETNVAEDGEWKATVYGDAGGQPKLDGTEWKNDTNPDGDYYMMPYYSVIENDDETVDMRMGILQNDDSVGTGESVGKIASSSDGVTMYYKELTAEDDFVLTATATINQVDNTNNQVAFGLMVRDDLEPMVNNGTRTKGNAISVGSLRMNAAGSENDPMVKAFYRQDTKLITGSTDPSLIEETQVAPAPGDSIDLKIEKNGDLFILTYGDQAPVYAYNKVTMTDDMYAGLFVSRAANISFSNISFEKVERNYTSIKVTQVPDKTLYISGSDTALDTTGLVVEGTLPDGSSVVLDESEYAVAGFFEVKDSVGTYPMTVVCGDCTATFDISLEPLKISSINVDYPTAKSVFYVGSKFSTVGLQVSVVYNDGTSETLDEDMYILKIDGTVVDDSLYFTDDMVGKKTVTVEYTDQDPTVDPNGKSDSFEITVEPAEIDGLYIASLPAKTTYYLGDELDTAGLVVRAAYNLGGTIKYQALLDSEYTVSGFDSSAPAASQTLTVSLNRDPSITVTFNIVVKERIPVTTEITTYPRTTFHVGEAYDAKGMVLSTVYDNEDVEEMDNNVYYYFDGSKYYTADGDVTEAEAKAADYYIDLSNYNNTVVGTTEVTIVYKNFQSTTLQVTIEEPVDYIWKPMIFGASSLGVQETDDPSEIYVTKADGHEILVDGSNYDDAVGYMENGKLTNVKSVRLNSWDGAGKISGDQDGIAYYYTKVDSDSNFTLSADVYVNRYTLDPDDPDDYAEIQKTKTEAEALLGRTVSDNEAIDMARDGQESFGLEARDAIPFLAQDGLGDDNLITVDTNKAQVDANGEPINIYEAYVKGMSAVDYRGNTRQVNRSNVGSVFASNIVLAGGYSGATYSKDITSTSYYKNTHLNRINLFVRKAVGDYALSGGTRVGPYDSTDQPPLKGDMYNITLQKINYGYKITTYNYQTGETRSNYSFNTTDGLDELLTIQEDRDYVWVGFYACRNADIDVSNIELYETDPETDPVISNLTEETYSPNVTVESSLYTSTTDYTLVLKANNYSGGLVTITQNGTEVYTDMPITRKATSYPVTLDPSSTTEFTVVYTPSRVDDCVSYDPVVLRFNIVCKDLASDLEDIYVSPTGSVATGDGSRENPIDLESAIGLSLPGQRIVMLDGTYTVKDKITIPLTNTGTPIARKYLVADEGANPVIDLQNKTGGFSISGYYWTFEGFTVKNAAGNTKAFEVGGQHIIVDKCTFHDNGDSGLQISRTDSSDDINDWPAYNLVKNCESYNNNDPSKNNADGFAAKLTSGYGNIFYRCISHHNVDDGWDLYTKLASGVIGPVTLEECVAYKQGYELQPDGTDKVWSDPDGCNGFKTGGENISVMHYIKDSITFENIGNGIDANFNPWLKVRNVISYANETRNIALYSDMPSNYSYDIEGLVSYKGTQADRIGTVSYDENVSYENTADTPLLNSTNYFIYGFNDTGSADPSYGFDNEAVFNENYGFDNYTDNGSKLTYSTLKSLANGTYDLNSYNSDLEKIDDSFFKSVDSSDVLNEYGRYSRDENGDFIFGDFLARTTPYVHDPADEIDYSNVETTETTTEEATETTTDAVTETTTKASSSSGGSSSSSGGSGGSSHKASGTAVETTTVATTEDVTEATTEAKYFVTPSGVVITPPAEGVYNVNFTDIASRAWAVDSINKLASAGIVNGVSATSFAPDAYSKRADFIVMLVKTLGLTGSTDDNFDDVAAGSYYADAIAIAKAAGIATGYGDGNFGPENTITRQDMMVLVANALEFAGIELNTDTSVLDSFADANQIAEYAKPYVAALVNLGLASGTDNGIEPTALITRAQMSVLIANVYDLVLDAADAYMAAQETVAEETTEATTETEEDTTVSDEETTEEVTDEASTDETTEETTEATTEVTTEAE